MVLIGKVGITPLENMKNLAISSIMKKKNYPRNL